MRSTKFCKGVQATLYWEWLGGYKSIRIFSKQTNKWYQSRRLLCKIGTRASNLDGRKMQKIGLRCASCKRVGSQVWAFDLSPNCFTTTTTTRPLVEYTLSSRINWTLSFHLTDQRHCSKSWQKWWWWRWWSRGLHRLGFSLEESTGPNQNEAHYHSYYHQHYQQHLIHPSWRCYWYDDNFVRLKIIIKSMHIYYISAAFREGWGVQAV